MQSVGTKAAGSEQGKPFKRSNVHTFKHQFIFDDETTLKFFRTISPGIRTVLLQNFEPDGTASIISSSRQNLDIAVAKYHRISEAQRRHSVIVRRHSDAITLRDGSAQHAIIPILHAPTKWPDFIYCHWLKLIAGEADMRVFPQYFFPAPGNPELQHALRCWTKAFSRLKADMLCPGFPNVRWLERNCGIFNTYLNHSSKQLFGRPPGFVLQVCKTFLQTAECMRKERQHLARTGTRKSFLQEVEWDFRKCLPKYFGIQYSALAQASRERLWSVVFFEVGGMATFRKS